MRALSIRLVKPNFDRLAESVTHAQKTLDGHFARSILPVATCTYYRYTQRTFVASYRGHSKQRLIGKK